MEKVKAVISSKNMHNKKEDASKKPIKWYSPAHMFKFLTEILVPLSPTTYLLWKNTSSESGKCCLISVNYISLLVSF